MLHVLACKVVELVQILRIAADNHAAVAVLNIYHGLEHDTCTILNKLSK